MNNTDRVSHTIEMPVSVVAQAIGSILIPLEEMKLIHDNVADEFFVVDRQEYDQTLNRFRERFSEEPLPSQILKAMQPDKKHSINDVPESEIIVPS